MIEITGNLFEPHTYQSASTGLSFKGLIYPNAICITTNGFVKKNGEAVMGRGCAAEANRKWPGLAAEFGKQIKENGNIVQLIVGPHCTSNGEAILSFPVKPAHIVYDGYNVVRHMAKRFKVGDRVPGWAAKADKQLIVQSATELQFMADHMKWKCMVLPRPGCGAEILDDRFYSITFRNE
jgi:hypothetical protein